MRADRRGADPLPGPTLAYMWGYLQEAGRTTPILNELLGLAVFEAEARGLPVPGELYPLPPDRSPAPRPSGAEGPAAHTSS